MDIWGRSATSNNTLGILINPLPPPAPVINDGEPEVVAPAGSAASFNNSGTSCPGGGCTTLWDLQCPDERGGFSNRTGDSIDITIGGDDGFDVNAAGAQDPFNCESKPAACAQARCVFRSAGQP